MIVFCPLRFHNLAKEPALNYDVVLPVDDDVQLSVVQYRNKLYEVRSSHKCLLCNIQLHYIRCTAVKPISQNILKTLI